MPCTALHVSTCGAKRAPTAVPGAMPRKKAPTRHAGAFAAALEMAEKLVLRRKFFAAHRAPLGCLLRARL